MIGYNEGQSQFEKHVSFFVYNWNFPAYSGVFLLTVDNFSFLLTVGVFLAYNFSFSTYSSSFLLTVGKCV